MTPDPTLDRDPLPGLLEAARILDGYAELLRDDGEHDEARAITSAVDDLVRWKIQQLAKPRPAPPAQHLHLIQGGAA